MRFTLPGRSALALLLGAALAGCPLPQTLPEYPASGTITPPRIQSDTVTPLDTVVLVDANCALLPPPSFTLSARVVDENTYELVEARWFVDYDPGRAATVTPIPPIQLVAGPADGLTIERSLDSFVFQPYGFDPAGSEQAYRTGGGIHVVELVVSNNFATEVPPPVPAHARPWRTPLSTATQSFETQVYRWTFHYVPTGTLGARCAYP
jgi:hypothetical protein